MFCSHYLYFFTCVFFPTWFVSLFVFVIAFYNFLFPVCASIYLLLFFCNSRRYSWIFTPFSTRIVVSLYSFLLRVISYVFFYFFYLRWNVSFLFLVCILFPFYFQHDSQLVSLDFLFLFALKCISSPLFFSFIFSLNCIVLLFHSVLFFLGVHCFTFLSWDSFLGSFTFPFVSPAFHLYTVFTWYFYLIYVSLCLSFYFPSLLGIHFKDHCVSWLHHWSQFSSSFHVLRGSQWAEAIIIISLYVTVCLSIRQFLFLFCILKHCISVCLCLLFYQFSLPRLILVASFVFFYPSSFLFEPILTNYLLVSSFNLPLLLFLVALSVSLPFSQLRYFFLCALARSLLRLFSHFIPSEYSYGFPVSVFILLLFYSNFCLIF